MKLTTKIRHLFRKVYFKRAIMLLLLPALALQGCFLFDEPAATPSAATSESPEPEDTAAPAIPPTGAQPTRGRFTLRYDSNSTLNPITSLSSDNILLSSLMYESLFVLDGELNAHPLLCESWSIEDEYTQVFIIKPDIPMSDGTFLTAEDVVYTLRQAMRVGRYINRFRCIDTVSATDDLTVRVTLKSSNTRFYRLLDVPIIKNGSIDSGVPPGSGPYTFTSTPSLRLESFSSHRDFADLPLWTIYLRECADSEVAELFDDGELSLLWDDPSNAINLRLNRLHETHYYETTALQFIGFNARSLALGDPDVRRAIGYAVERQNIIDAVMPRQALASPLAFSPAYNLYDVEWEYTYNDPLVEMALWLDYAGLEDNNNDSFLEYPDRNGGFISFSIDFIVNSENRHKIAAANMIADMMRRTGFDISVRELPWDRFIEALQTGDFDMYYGEIVLSADFDLSPLLLPDSPINYGRTGNSEYWHIIDDFLRATMARGERAAARQLCDEITRNSPFVPILYKRYAVYMPTGAITGASPSQSGVFRSFTEWTIDVTMLS